jgi:hypothetical protein
MEGHKIRTVKLVLQPDRSEKKEGMNGNERE